MPEMPLGLDFAIPPPRHRDASPAAQGYIFDAELCSPGCKVLIRTGNTSHYHTAVKPRTRYEVARQSMGPSLPGISNPGGAQLLRGPILCPFSSVSTVHLSTPPSVLALQSRSGPASGRISALQLPCFRRTCVRSL